MPSLPGGSGCTVGLTKLPDICVCGNERSGLCFFLASSGRCADVLAAFVWLWRVSVADYLWNFSSYNLILAVSFDISDWETNSEVICFHFLIRGWFWTQFFFKALHSLVGVYVCSILSKGFFISVLFPNCRLELGFTEGWVAQYLSARMFLLFSDVIYRLLEHCGYLISIGEPQDCDIFLSKRYLS